VLNQPAIDALKKKKEELESIRDQLLPGGGNLKPIFDEIDELLKKLLKELGYSDDPQKRSTTE